MRQVVEPQREFSAADAASAIGAEIGLLAADVGGELDAAALVCRWVHELADGGEHGRSLFGERVQQELAVPAAAIFQGHRL